MRSLLLLAALTVAGCAASAPADLEPDIPSVTAADFAGTVWTDTCDDTVYWLRFNADGSVDYSASGPDDWANDGTDTWRLDGTDLVLSWTDGFRIATYDVSGGLADRYEGTSAPNACEATPPVLARIR